MHVIDTRDYQCVDDMTSDRARRFLRQLRELLQDRPEMVRLFTESENEVLEGIVMHNDYNEMTTCLHECWKPTPHVYARLLELAELQNEEDYV